MPIVKTSNKSTDTRHIVNNFTEKAKIVKTFQLFFLIKMPMHDISKINVQINDKTTLTLKWSNGIVTKLFHFPAKSISH